ncbi:MAG: NADPH-dependent glutamate synthase [Myxococcota bacterium]
MSENRAGETTQKPKKEKIPRQAMPEQKPEERIKNFNEVPYGYSLELAQLEAKRCIQCKKPKCIEGCPVNINIPAFIDMIVEGNLEESIRIMKSDNMLPAICGRVCPQETQCEEKCVIGIKDKPVAIGRLERFIADWERNEGKMKLPDKAPASGKKVAVVGAGPAGLTVTGDLLRMGHDVTVFEALHAPGGVLIYGIPEFRLPKEIVFAEVDMLKLMGAKFRFNSVIGRTYSMSDLTRDFDAVFLGTGAGLPYFMDIEGENLNGVYSANEYLTRVNLMRAFRFPADDTPIAKSKNVAVVGGGNVAMDAARTAKRLGAENVYLVYRRSRAEMPARIEEIHHAEEEGIDFRILCNPLKYEGDETGRVKSALIQRMELGEPDASGRRKPVPIEGDTFILDVDTVVVAIGNGPNPLIASTTKELETTRKGTLAVKDNETLKTSMKGVFAGGDIVVGAATVILAMGMGRKAAKAIDDYLKTGEW